MKLQHFLSAFFVPAVLVLILLTGTCAASFVCSNSITLENGGMSWDYEECITGRDAVFFKGIIDNQAGNNDSFVNAWEIRNMELKLRDRLEESIEKKPDVKLNGTSEAVELRNVEFWLSEEALGQVLKSTSITNTALVTYSFKEENPGPETSIWLLGTPDSDVTISLPPGFDANRTEGLEDKSTEFEDNREVLKGSFGPEGEVTLWLSVNESFASAALQEAENENETLESETRAVENETLQIEEPKPEEIGANTGFFENFLRRLCLSPKT